MKLCYRILSVLLVFAMLASMMPMQYAHAAMFTNTGVQTTATTGTLTIELKDSYGDGWNGNKLELYINDVLSATYKVGEDKSKFTTTLSYDSTQYYAFKWVKGSYAEECSITISLDGTTLFSATGSDCASYTDGQVVFTCGKVPVIVASGTCGDNVSWTLDDGGKLVISGTGNMDDYCSVNRIYGTIVSIDYMSPPWDDRSVKTVVIEEGVTRIGSGAFWWDNNLTSITIADSVKSIGDCAFELCGGLTSITIPESVTSIGVLAFSECRNLTEITIPASVTRIGEAAFVDASNLKEITFQGDAPTLGDDLFLNVTANAYYPTGNSTWTTSVLQNYGGAITWKAIVPVIASGTCGVSTTWHLNADGVLTISGTGETDYYDSDDGVYPPWRDYKDSIVKVVVEDGVVYVGSEAFSGCENLTSASLPDGLVAMSPYMFSGCSALSDVNIPGTVGAIYNAAFSGCTSLTSVTLPDSLSVIWDYAFNYCGLTELTIPDSVRKIWNSAFKMCLDLETIVIGNGLSELGEVVFADCAALETVCFTGSAPHCGANNVFSRGNNPYGIIAYYPAGDSSWTETARNCISWNVTWKTYCEHTWIDATCTTPKTCSVCGVTEGGIGDHTRDSAHKCTVCGQIGGTCGENVTWVLDENGVLTISGNGPMADYAEYGNNAPWRSNYTDAIVKVVIEDGVTSIGSFSFWQCKSLTEISIPDSVQRMGDGVFYGCESLQAVTIPYGVPSLGSNLFYKCTALTSIVIPDSVTSIGVSAFLMSGVRYVVLPASVTKIEGDAFSVSGKLWHVLYTGTEAQRARIDQLVTYETYLDKATWHYGASGDEIIALNEGDCTTKKLFECGICGSVCTETIYGGSHTYDQEVATEKYLKFAATCTAAAVYYKSCVCGEKGANTFVSGEPNGHSYESVVTEPTCTEPGTTVYTCTVCGDTYSEEIEAIGHDLTQHEAKAPTCTDIGWEAYETCSRCDYSTYAELPADGVHTWGDWVVEKAATCTENGSRTRSCAYCVASWTEMIRALGHDLTQHEAKAPTCIDIGWEAYETCSRCDYSTYVELPSNGHDYEATVTEPTCTEGGYTTYTCHCGDTYVADYVAESGHYYEYVVTVPTCKEEGYTTYTCTVCGDSYVDNYVDALGHQEVVDKAAEPTCTEDGLTEGSHCEVCGEVLVAQTEIPATGHDYEAAVTEPTCTEDGFTTYTCANCGDSYADDHIDALGHQEIADEAVEATCTEDGLTAGSHCEVCGDVLIAQTVILAIGHLDEDKDFICDTCGADLCTDHVEQIIPEVLPTCTEEGMTEGVKCANCGEILVARQIISALGHSYEAIVTAPTCTEDGYTTCTCTVCGDSYVSDHVDALGHQEVVDGAVEATCTEDGLTEGRHCGVCGEVLTEQEVIPAAGHVDADKNFLCDSCGEDLCTEHIVEIIAEKLPTCTEDGLTQGARCANCGEILVEQEMIPALGHSYVSVVIIPTCTEEGYTTHTCENCDDSYIDEFVAAKGHSYGEWVIDLEPTCTEPGSKSRTCACGETETEELPALGHDFLNGKCNRCGELDAVLEVAQGDVNGDGKVDTTDAKLIMQYDLGLIGEDAVNLAAMDVNGDGKIDTTDAKLIMQLDLGIITEFPTP